MKQLTYDSPIDPDLATLDIIRTFDDNLGGGDIISGNAGSDIILGGTGSDTIYGDDIDGSNGVADLRDYILGDNGEVLLLNNLISQLKTTDATELTGGVDTINGNAEDDVILGGAGGDEVHGNGGNDLILGDFAEVWFLSEEPRFVETSGQGMGPRTISSLAIMSASTGGRMLSTLTSPAYASRLWSVPASMVWSLVLMMACR